MKQRLRKDRTFVNEFIPRVSRTFALAIRFLPPNLRHSVFTAYLLCRVADTIEDSPHICPDEKHSRLLRMRSLLAAAENDIKLGLHDIAPLYDAVSESHGHEHRLLGRSGELFEILGRLPLQKRRIIYHWAGEMAGGMAEFSRFRREDGNEVRTLGDTIEWDKYCYHVAGTVGHMLTELFVTEYNLDSAIALALKRLCNSFGLGLQKVNTIKDVPLDRERGFLFLPGDIIARHGLSASLLEVPHDPRAIKGLVFELTESAQRHLDDAIEYTTIVPSRLRGVRMFLTVPTFLAAETLNVIRKNPVQAMTGPPVKIRRRDVARLTTAARMHSASNEAISRYYKKLRSKKAL
jgi:farnesyl-diphosphate farnesyltransferase